MTSASRPKCAKPCNEKNGRPTLRTSVHTPPPPPPDNSTPPPNPLSPPPRKTNESASPNPLELRRRWKVARPNTFSCDPCSDLNHSGHRRTQRGLLKGAASSWHLIVLPRAAVSLFFIATYLPQRPCGNAFQHCSQEC